MVFFFLTQVSLHLLHANGYLMAEVRCRKDTWSLDGRRWKKKPSTWKTLHCFFI